MGEIDRPTVTATTMDFLDHANTRVQEIDVVLELEGWGAVQVLFGWNPDTGLEFRAYRFQDDDDRAPEKARTLIELYGSDVDADH